MTRGASPRWLTRRQLVISGLVLVAAAVAIAWNHRRSERAFLRDVARAMPLSVELSATFLADWFALHGSAAAPDALRESALPQFNVAASDDKTQRTILVEPRGERLVVRLVSAPGGGPRPADPVPAVSVGLEGVPAWHAQLRRPMSRPDEGVGVGLLGQPVVRAHRPIRGTPFLLVRERDAAELLARLRPALWISDAIFALVALLAVALGLLRVRARALRTERDAMALRSAFVSSVSHELRTPLTQIRMYAEMLQLGYLREDEERTRALEVIGREAGRLGVLVDQALAFVRDGHRPSAPAGAAPPVASVADAAARATATLTPLLAERQVRVAGAVPDDLRVPMHADALQQVLLNLMANALKYGPVGQTIRVEGRRVGARVQVTVDDEGPGVPASDRLRVWQPFVRGAEVADASGSGIGLAIVRDLVVAAGGSVAIVDAPAGRGARLLLELPASE